MQPTLGLKVFDDFKLRFLLGFKTLSLIILVLHRLLLESKKFIASYIYTLNLKNFDNLKFCTIRYSKFAVFSRCVCR